MRTLAVLMLLAAPGLAQDETVDEKGQDWKKLSDTWKSIGDLGDKAPDGKLDDQFIEAAAGIHNALCGEKSFLPEDEARLLKGILKARLANKVRMLGDSMSPNPFGNVKIQVLKGFGGRGGEEEEKKVDVPKELEKMEKGFSAADEDGFKKALKALKKLKVVDEKTPGWKLRRIRSLLEALEGGKAYPAVAKPDEETLKKINEYIEMLGAESMVDRDEASKALTELCPGAVPALRKAAEGHEDAEVRTRAKDILGID